ncbi:Phosphofructokinase family protein [Trifolium repens]|nr:Phosphofructokinase family protein [Trifolium repens]
MSLHCFNLFFHVPCQMVQLLRVEFGDSTTTANPFYKVPDAYGHPLALRATAKVPDAQIITEHPPIRVGIVFCGRQSPGGHNVIWGLHSALKIHNPNSVLLGLLASADVKLLSMLAYLSHQHRV